MRLHRVMGALRRASPALRARGFFYYFAEADHLRQGVIAYRREAGPERLLVLVNFSDAPARVWVPFARAGRWEERIDGLAALDVAADGDWAPVDVPSNYGAVYALG